MPEAPSLILFKLPFLDPLQFSSFLFEVDADLILFKNRFKHFQGRLIGLSQTTWPQTSALIRTSSTHWIRIWSQKLPNPPFRHPKIRKTSPEKFQQSPQHGFRIAFQDSTIRRPNISPPKVRYFRGISRKITGQFPEILRKKNGKMGICLGDGSYWFFVHFLFAEHKVVVIFYRYFLNLLSNT